MIQQGSVQHGAIHFGARFPVTETPCGVIGPSADLWRFVTCLECLRLFAEKDARIKERYERLLAEAETMDGQPFADDPSHPLHPERPRPMGNMPGDPGSPWFKRSKQ